MKKFDYCIGNPPYNADFSDSGDNGKYAKPVYNEFMDAANTVANSVELVHPARFLFNAGSTPKSWNEKMLQDAHFKVLKYVEDATEIFPDTDIKGGIAISLHDDSRNFGAIEVFSKYPEMNVIRNKVWGDNTETSLSSIMFNQNRFDLDSLYAEHPEYRSVIGSGGKDRRFRNNIFDKVDAFTVTPTSKDDVKVYGLISNKRIWRYISRKYVDVTHENLDSWKVLVVRVNGNGTFDEILSTPEIEAPGEGYTQTFIGIGSLPSKEEAMRALKYVKSKFARAMLHILKTTQDNSIETWKYVPIQDFSESSDIDWSRSVHEIDSQLYKKYGLSEKEIDFIESHVKEMA